MMIHEITDKAGSYKARKRIGRGEGSGHGKTASRGHKGAGSRSGWTRRPGFEGGQMSIVRRMPKRGFTNVQFRNLYHVVNLKTLESRLESGAEVTAEVLAKAGIIRDAKLPLKILGEGELTKKLNVTAARFSKSARQKIEQAGGTVTEVVRKKWTRPGKPGRAAGRRQAPPAKAAAPKGKPAGGPEKKPKDQAAEKGKGKGKSEGKD